jgi:hypothetical protein
MNRPVKSPLALALLATACVQRVNLGKPTAESDAGVEPEPDMGVDLGAPDEGPPPSCPHLDRPACDARADCDWYGGDAGYCAAAGPCDEHLDHRACVTDADCDWNGEAAGFCEPAHDPPTDCSNLYLVPCHETPGCVWDGGDWGECYGVPDPPGCAGLTMADCLTNGRCLWYGADTGFCDDAAPCQALLYEDCITRSSCDWRGGLDGFCGPAEGVPGGCAELTSAPCMDTAGCVWDGDPGECSGGPTMLPECEPLGEVDCHTNALCDWYGTFCDRSGVCDELGTHGACVLRAACDWEGEDTGTCIPTTTGPSDACSHLGFFDCGQASGCVWEGGDWGECFAL